MHIFRIFIRVFLIPKHHLVNNKSIGGINSPGLSQSTTRLKRLGIDKLLLTLGHTNIEHRSMMPPAFSIILLFPTRNLS